MESFAMSFVSMLLALGVVIVEHRGTRWMLGVTAGGISTIAHWSAGADAAAPMPPAHGDDAAVR